jgi:hypothetical protein
VEPAPDFTRRLLMEADAAGLACRAGLRVGETGFPGIEAVGGVSGADPATCEYARDRARTCASVDSPGGTDGRLTVAMAARPACDVTRGTFLGVTVIVGTAAR